MIANIKKKKKSSFKNIFVSTVKTIFLVAILIFLLGTNVKIRERRSEMARREENIKNDLSAIRAMNDDLNQRLSGGANQQYLEKVAREQFDMKATGEEIIVISRSRQEESQTAEKNNWWDWDQIKQKLNLPK